MAGDQEAGGRSTMQSSWGGQLTFQAAGLTGCCKQHYLKHTRISASFCFPAQKRLQPEAEGTSLGGGPRADHRLRLDSEGPCLSRMTSLPSTLPQATMPLATSRLNTVPKPQTSFILSSSLSESRCCSNVTAALRRCSKGAF